MAQDAIPPGPQTGGAFGRWVEVAGTVGRLASQLPGLHGVSVVIDVLAALTDAQNGQTALLKSIKADTAALRIAPFKVAVESLGEALRVGPADPSWDTYIHRTEEKLSDALALVSGPQEEALVEFDLGITWFLMGHKGNARHHIERSLQCGHQVVNEYVRKARNQIHDERPFEDRVKRWELSKAGRRAVVAGQTVWVVGTFGLGGAVFTAYDATVVRARRQARSDLNDFIGFYNLIQYTVSSMSGNAKPQYLILDQLGYDDFRLRLR